MTIVVEPSAAPAAPSGWGDLPSHWQVARLRYVVQCLDGRRIPINAEERGSRQGRYPYWGANKVIDHIDDWLFDEPLVLLGEDGAPFYDHRRDVAFAVDGKLWVNNHAHVLRCGRRVSPAYLGRVLNSVDYHLFITGSTRDKLTQRAMGSIAVPLPPLDEQVLMNRFLDHAELALGKAIAAKRQLVDLVEEVAASTRWECLAEGNEPSHTRDGVEWMGPVAPNWRIVRLKALLREVDRRSTAGTETLLSLRMREGLVPSAEHSPKPQDPTKLVGYKLVAPGTLVVNRMRASIGLIGIATQPGLVSPDYATFERRPESQVHLPYLLGLLRSPQMGAVIRSESRGMGTGSSGFLRIYTDRLSTIRVALPPPAEQRDRSAEARRRTEALTDAVRSTLDELEVLLEYRAQLVKDVVTGTRDVQPDAAVLPEVDAGELDAVLSTASEDIDNELSVEE